MSAQVNISPHDYDYKHDEAASDPSYAAFHGPDTPGFEFAGEVLDMNHDEGVVNIVTAICRHTVELAFEEVAFIEAQEYARLERAEKAMRRAMRQRGISQSPTGFFGCYHEFYQNDLDNGLDDTEIIDINCP